MAIAGKVAITLKGDWNNTTTYEKLDAVTYNNGLYIAKETSTGVTPVNGDTWMLSVQSVDAIEFEKIIDGTTVVGKATNANTADTLNVGTADLENIKTTFTETTTRENINSKETLGTLFGKIKKWFADLKTVAFSGSYNDLSDKPTIPSVGNGTITITQAGETKGSFTTNQTGNTTIALTDDNTTYSTATQSANGLMSASDKSKLDGIATGANAYTLPSATSSTLGGVKTTDSSAVTDSTGLALAATEKNASISGTLANQISTLNNNLTPIKNALSSDAMKLNENSDLNDIRGFNIFWWDTSTPKNAPKTDLRYCVGISFGDYFTAQIVFVFTGTMYSRICEAGGNPSQTSWEIINKTAINEI